MPTLNNCHFYQFSFERLWWRRVKVYLFSNLEGKLKENIIGYRAYNTKTFPPLLIVIAFCEAYISRNKRYITPIGWTKASTRIQNQIMPFQALWEARSGHVLAVLAIEKSQETLGSTWNFAVPRRLFNCLTFAVRLVHSIYPLLFLLRPSWPQTKVIMLVRFLTTMQSSPGLRVMMITRAKMKKITT